MFCERHLPEILMAN